MTASKRPSALTCAATFLAPAIVSRSPMTTASASGSARLRSEEHTSELQSPDHLVCRLLLENENSNLRTAPHASTAWTVFERGLPTIPHVEFVVLPSASLVPFGGLPVLTANRHAVPHSFTPL